LLCNKLIYYVCIVDTVLRHKVQKVTEMERLELIQKIGSKVQNWAVSYEGLTLKGSDHDYFISPEGSDEFLTVYAEEDHDFTSKVFYVCYYDGDNEFEFEFSKELKCVVSPEFDLIINEMLEACDLNADRILEREQAHEDSMYDYHQDLEFEIRREALRA